MLRAFQLLRMGQVTHLYFISFGYGKLIGFQIECAECKTRLGTKEFRHATMERGNPNDLAALAATTLPNLPELLGDRLAIEQQVREAPHELPGEVRRTLLQEPFGILNPPLESRSESTHIDQPIVMGCLATVALLALGIPGIAYVPKEWEDAAGYALLGAIGLALTYTIVQLCLVNRRYYRVKTTPLLVKALKPLKPTQDELETVVRRCRELGLKIGEQTRVEELCRHLTQE